MAVCGNFTCEAGETCTNCPGDCGGCMAVCGDGVCDPAELCSGVADAACPVDIVQPNTFVCNAGSGDVCDPGESVATCPLDCMGMGGDPCCTMGPGPGCAGGDPAAVACVCMFNPACCSGPWDMICAAFYTICGAICM